MYFFMSVWSSKFSRLIGLLLLQPPTGHLDVVTDIHYYVSKRAKYIRRYGVCLWCKQTGFISDSDSFDFHTHKNWMKCEMELSVEESMKLNDLKNSHWFWDSWSDIEPSLTMTINSEDSVHVSHKKSLSCWKWHQLSQVGLCLGKVINWKATLTCIYILKIVLMNAHTLWDLRWC